jgi:murein DD-endopeptidase MepM/ murein hydrolase activator NlpD
MRSDPCAGYQIVVATDMVGRHEESEGNVYAVYAHAKPLDGLTVSQKLKPGDPIARIIPLLNTKCYMSREHVHYELRVKNKVGRDINPHQFWADGPGKVSCFKEGMLVPPGKTVAPIRCRASQ